MSMNRISRTFKSYRESNRKALMPYITVGDPDIDGTRKILENMYDAGACVCELGFPFSDPIADGPVIQASMKRALDNGANVQGILEMVRAFRDSDASGAQELGLVAMISFSMVYKLGVGDFINRCKDAGIDGFIVPDLPLEQAQRISRLVAEADLTCSFLIAPGTSVERAREIAKVSSGFIYMLARAGVTGEQREMPADLPERIADLRTVTDLPIAVGFGVSTADHVREVVSVADAAIVGSAIMRRVDDVVQTGEADLGQVIGRFAGELAAGLS